LASAFETASDALQAASDCDALHPDVSRMLAAVGSPTFVDAARDLTKRSVALLERISAVPIAVPAELSAHLREALKLAVTAARKGVRSSEVESTSQQLLRAIDELAAQLRRPTTVSAAPAVSAPPPPPPTLSAEQDALCAAFERAEMALGTAAIEVAPVTIALDALDEESSEDLSSAQPTMADIAVTARGVSAALGKLRQFATLTPQQIAQLARVSCKAMALLHSQLLRVRPADAPIVATRREALSVAACKFVSEAHVANIAQVLLVEINCSDAMLRDTLRALVDEQQRAGGAPLTPRSAQAMTLDRPPPSPRGAPVPAPKPNNNNNSSSMPPPSPRGAAPAPAQTTPAVASPSPSPSASPSPMTTEARESVGWASVRPGRAMSTARGRRSRSLDPATTASAFKVMASAASTQSPTRSRFLSTSTTAERPLVPPCDYESGRLLNLDTELVLAADGQVKGGTLPALVSRLYADDQHHASYVNLFMHTFRAFVDSARLLKILQATYTALLPVGGDSDAVKTEKKRYRLRVGNALKKLVEECHDDDTNAALTDDFVTFIDTSMFPTDDTLALTIKLKFFQRQSIVSTQLEQQFSEPPPKPILPRSGTRASIHTLEPVELARQMTLLDSELLRKIGPFELIGVAYGAKSGAQLRAKNLLAMIARFNCTSNFVVATLVAEKQLKARGALLKKVLRTAEECRKLNNFNAVFAIVAGLNSASIHRLRKTWDQLSDAQHASFAELGELVSANKSFKVYRDTLHGINPPCVPYLGVYQTDLTFIDQGNPDMLAGRARARQL
jgi:hypothetical protein